MSEELINYLLNHEPTKEEAHEFWKSVMEEENKFKQITESLRPTSELLDRRFC